ncbi:MAG: GCN5-related N-acetyltransferase [Herbinix sp.]|jgi:predicted GNAT family N-acyltransferase|nr:GCN5-related N-acetyltransferase [Herbinix sp.]
MPIQGKLLSYGDDLSEVFTIRRKVFVEEKQIPEEKEFDNYDAEAMHVVVYEEEGNKKAVATGRIEYNGQDCRIGRVAVLEEYRGKRYGDFAVRMLLNRAFMAGIKEVTITNEVTLEPFFSKIGFRRVKNEMDETGLKFCIMNINANDMTTLCNKEV